MSEKSASRAVSTENARCAQRVVASSRDALGEERGLWAFEANDPPRAQRETHAKVQGRPQPRSRADVRTYESPRKRAKFAPCTHALQCDWGRWVGANEMRSLCCSPAATSVAASSASRARVAGSIRRSRREPRRGSSEEATGAQQRTRRRKQLLQVWSRLLHVTRTL